MSNNWPRTDGVALSHACLAKLLAGYSSSSAPFGGPHTGGFVMAFGDGSVR
jgi:prepilin-type processing-associated H-X9-DG protein